MADARERFKNPADLAQIMDSTLLRPEAVEGEYIAFLREAVDADFRCAFVPLFYLPLAQKELARSRVRLGAPLGFPLGFTMGEAKKYEAVLALQHGARDLDMVINVSALKSRRYRDVQAEIAEVVRVCRRYDAGRQEDRTTVKVILETCYLTRDEIRRGAELSREAGADFVKTSTGLGPAGATVEDIAFLREVVGPGFGVKAAGGIRTLQDLYAMVEAGANRIGTSAAGAILAEFLHSYRW
jgi:deoxyribose-phosphate aldolase